jgi:anti-anti-sigma factor
MEITISDFGDLGKRVTLVGRLDIPGAAKIDVPLKELADSKTNIVVDMSGVDFIASLGMRSLVIAAKTLVRNGRTLVLLNPTPLVADALTKAGLQTLLPMVQSESDAQALLRQYAR